MDPETLRTRIEEMVARRVRGGANDAESRKMLAEFLSTASRSFLPTALTYNDFATDRTAERFTEDYFADAGRSGSSPYAEAAAEVLAPPWWIVLEREAFNPGGESIQLPSLVLGPLEEATALEDLNSEAGSTYTLSTLDAKNEGYVVTEAYAIASHQPPPGERTAMYEHEPPSPAAPTAPQLEQRPADITVEHSAGGTLVHGTARGDQEAAAALKANGFRWSRNLDAWYLPRNLTHDTRDRRVAGLQAALGDRIEVEIPDDGRRLTAAEKDAAKRERATDRSERMSARADKLQAKADTMRAETDRFFENVPLGQPNIVDTSAGRAFTRKREKMHAKDWKAHETAQAAAGARAAADRAEQTATGTDSVVTITNRIERNEALVRKVDRELDAHTTAQRIIDKVGGDHPKIQAIGTAQLGIRSPERLAQLAQLKAEALDAIVHDCDQLEAAGGVTYGKHNVSPGDIIVSRAGYLPVLRANAKSATVPTGYTWTDTLPWSKVTKVIEAEQFTPDQVRQILEHVDPDDKHRAAAFAKTLARAEQHTAKTAAWDAAIDSFHHRGPGGDQALEQAHPELVAALRELPVGSTMTIADQVVTRQATDAWAVGQDDRLASPWVVVQSIQSARDPEDRETATATVAASHDATTAAADDEVRFVPVRYQHVDFAQMPDGTAHRLTYDDNNPYAQHAEIHAMLGDQHLGKVHWTPGYGNATVEVDPDHRRQGIATRLMQEAQALDPSAAERWTPVTSAGQELGRRLGLDAPSNQTNSPGIPTTSSAWSREDVSLLEGLDVDTAARQRLAGGQHHNTQPAVSPRPGITR